MRTLIAMTTFVAAHCGAGAAGSIDQAFEPSGRGPSGVVYTNYDGIFANQAQTFTVGAFGYLDRVDILIGRTLHARPLLIDIRPTLGGVPLLDNSSALASLSLAPSAIPVIAGTDYPPDRPDWVTLDFTGSPIPVVAGQQLALVLCTGLAIYGEYYWFGENGDPYPGGSAYAQAGLVAQTTAQWFPIRSGGEVPSIVVDYGFRTFVTPVPEPQMLTLFASSGILGFAFYAFRRKRGCGVSP